MNRRTPSWAALSRARPARTWLLIAIWASLLAAIECASLAVGTSATIAIRAQGFQPRPILIGAYVDGAQEDPEVLDQFARTTGATPGVVLMYQSWDAAENSFPVDLVREVRARGAVPMITWDPGRPGGATGPSCRLEEIWNGTDDAYITHWAMAAARGGQDTFVRWGHEMNGSWQCWSPGRDGNRTEDFVAAWRHIVEVFRRTGATNVKWVWSPNVFYDGASADVAPLYPGDSFVDLVALDGYNWGTAAGHRWQTFTEIFRASIDSISRLTARPLIIAETASAEVGGDKAAWITSALLVELPRIAPQVHAVIWFDARKETDWTVTSSAGALRAYQAVVKASGCSGEACVGIMASSAVQE